MFSKVSHVGWMVAVLLFLIVISFVAYRKMKQTIVFPDGTTAEISRSFAK